MSDVELEQAAMAPHRWIGLCGAFNKQNPNDTQSILWPRTTRIIEEVSDAHVFIVPGGRYLVNSTADGLSIWDLGYVSSADCKLITSVELGTDLEFFMVHTTPDGMGLTIFLPDIVRHITVFEVYPQSETPLLTQIPRLDWDSTKEEPVHYLPDTLIFREISEDRIVFRVLDYRKNYSIRFSAEVVVKKCGYALETFATKTAIIVFCQEEILVWAIPPLLPQPSDLPADFIDNNPYYIPPAFRIPFPDDIAHHVVELLRWKTISSWYFGSWGSIYFDILLEDSKRYRFKMIVKPDLSDASLHFVNTSKLTRYNFRYVFFQR